MLVQVGPPASSKTATPNHVLPVIPGDRNELVECHSEATRGRSPVTPDRPTKIVLRRSVESAQYAAEPYRLGLARSGITPSMSRKRRLSRRRANGELLSEPQERADSPSGLW